MAFSASFTIKAVDQFSAVAKLVAKNARMMKKAINELGLASEKTSDLQKKMAYSLRQNAQDFEKAGKAARKYRQELNNIKPPRTQGGGGIPGRAPSGGGMGSAALGGIGGSIAGAAGAYLSASGAQSFFAFASEMENATAGMSAITGATGANLKIIEDSAFNIADKYGRSSIDIMNAFKVVGSKRSELLKDTKALSEFTDISIKLATAGEVGDTTAAETLAKSLDIMGKGAGDAAKFANVIAAGVQAGSIEVNEISQALMTVGGGAKEAGMDFEQLNAGLQVMGKLRGGAVGGTAFGGILRGLRKNGYDLKKVGLAGVLEKVAKQYDSIATEAGKAAFMQELVGAEFDSEAVFLMRNTDLMKNYESQIRESNDALEQMARLRMDTRSIDISRVKNKFSRELYQGYLEAAPAITEMITALNNLGGNSGGLSDVISNLIKFVSTPLTGAINFLNTLGTILGVKAGEFSANLELANKYKSGELSLDQYKSAFYASQQKSADMIDEKLSVDINVNQDGKVVSAKAKNSSGLSLGNATVGTR